MEKLVLIGFVIILIGILFILIGSLTTSKTSVKYAFGGFIGPIPFGFFNDKKIFYILIGLMVLFLVLFFFKK